TSIPRLVFYSLSEEGCKDIPGQYLGGGHEQLCDFSAGFSAAVRTARPLGEVARQERPQSGHGCSAPSSSACWWSRTLRVPSQTPAAAARATSSIAWKSTWVPGPQSPEARRVSPAVIGHGSRPDKAVHDVGGQNSQKPKLTEPKI